MERDLVSASQISVPQMRSSSSIPDPITQLDGIPVHIRSVGTSRYLSSEASGRNVVLYDRDDGSLRQRWNLVYGELMMSGAKISLIGGNSSYNNALLRSGTLNGRYRPFLDTYSSVPTGIGITTAENSLYYYIKVAKQGGNIWDWPSDKDNVFVQPENSGSNQIMVGDNYYKGTMTMWEIIPVDEFEIKNITYELTTGDNLVVVPTLVDIRTVVNNTDEPITRQIQLQGVVTSSSSFSKTDKLTVSIKQDVSVKIGIAGFFEGSLSQGVSGSKEWSYTVGGTETRSTTISETLTYVVPSRTTNTVKMIASKYDASLTYIAELKGVTTGKTVYLKGKWDGIVVQETRIEFYNSDGKLLRSIKLESK